MKLAIVGTRHPAIKYAEFEKLLLSKIDESEITQAISGGAEGIDTYAKLFAGRHRIPLMEFLPQYSIHGKNAPLRRNTKIVREADTVIAFPSVTSTGTLHSIREAERMKKRLIIVRI